MVAGEVGARVGRPELLNLKYHLFQVDFRGSIYLCSYYFKSHLQLRLAKHGLLVSLYLDYGYLLDSSIIAVHGIIVSNVRDCCFVSIPYIPVDHDARRVIQVQRRINVVPVWWGSRRLRRRCLPRCLGGGLRFMIFLNWTGVGEGSINMFWWGWRRLRR